MDMLNHNEHDEIIASTFAKAANRWAWIPLLGVVFYFVFAPLALLQIGKGRTGFRLLSRGLVKILLLTVLPVVVLVLWAGLPSKYYPLLTNYCKHGYYDELSDDGILMQREHFRFGSIITRTTYYDDGKKKSYEEFSDGKRNGTCIYWYDNGNKRHEAEFKEDKENGASTYWYRNGQVRLKETLALNKRHGKCTWYTEDSKVEKEMNYTDGISQYQIDEAKKFGTPVTIDEDLGGGVTIKMVFIPAGEFMMGANDGDKIERPAHKVKITKGFYICETEVTQTQWAVLMGNNPSNFKDDNNPVEMVSWDNCQEFITKINTKTNNKFRLPTEAEWEYSCRAGTTTGYGFGNDFDDIGEYAWYDGNSKGSTHIVGELKANNWGLYDMHGNVWEWCSDWYGEYSSDEQTDPQGSKEGPFRVLRGGGWFDSGDFLRSACRNGGYPDDRYDDLGFRVVRSSE